MTGHQLEILPVPRQHWIVRCKGDTTPLSEHATLADEMIGEGEGEAAEGVTGAFNSGGELIAAKATRPAARTPGRSGASAQTACSARAAAIGSPGERTPG